MRLGSLFAMLLYSCAFLSCSACETSKSQTMARSNESGPAEGVPGSVSGVVRQIGNAPHVEYVITGVSTVFPGVKTYRISGDPPESVVSRLHGEIRAYGLIRVIEFPFGTSGKILKHYFVTIERVE